MKLAQIMEQFKIPKKYEKDLPDYDKNDIFQRSKQYSLDDLDFDNKSYDHEAENTSTFVSKDFRRLLDDALATKVITKTAHHLFMQLMDGSTQLELSKELGVSTTRIGQMVHKAFRAIRYNYGDIGEELNEIL